MKNPRTVFVMYVSKCGPRSSHVTVKINKVIIFKTRINTGERMKNHKFPQNVGAIPMGIIFLAVYTETVKNIHVFSFQYIYSWKTILKIRDGENMHIQKYSSHFMMV